MKKSTRQQFLKAIEKDARYPVEAYEFLHRGLDFTVRALHGEAESDEPRHVTGQELCEGLRRLALRRWGLLAKVVLAEWNIRSTRDFGQMVYFLIEMGHLGERESDSQGDFDDVYSFDEAFDAYDIPLDVAEE